MGLYSSAQYKRVVQDSDLDSDLFFGQVILMIPLDNFAMMMAEPCPVTGLERTSITVLVGLTPPSPSS